MTFDEPMSTSKCHTTLQMPNTVSNWLALKVFANVSAQLLTLDIDVDLESLKQTSCFPGVCLSCFVLGRGRN